MMRPSGEVAMAIVGVHNFVDAIGHYKDEVVSSEGGLWIVMMDGLLLIPLAMAAFFYPVAALIGVGVTVVFSIGGLLGAREYSRRHPHLPPAADDPPKTY
jgi:hypothetical protein